MTKTVLYIVNPENYFKKISSILKKELKNETLIYVTTNKPYSSLVTLFEKEKIRNKIFYVDCISKMVMGRFVTDEQTENCIFVGRDGRGNSCLCARRHEK